MRRRLVALFGALSISIAFAQPAAAVGLSVFPMNQTHNHGVQSSWEQSWSGVSPWDVAFCPRNSPAPTVCFASITNTTATYKYRYYTFWPCYTTNFQQYNWVNDGMNAQQTVWSYAKEYGGSPC
jgi:hypothetical protein